MIGLHSGRVIGQDTDGPVQDSLQFRPNGSTGHLTKWFLVEQTVAEEKHQSG